MKTLIIWVGQEETKQNLSKTIGRLVSREGVQYRIKIIGDTLPEVEEDCLVLAMGNNAVQVLAAQGIVIKNRTINSLRNQLHKLPSGVPVLVTYSPSIINTDYARYVDMQSDARTAIRYMQTGSILPQLGEYRYVGDFHEACQNIQLRFGYTGEPVVVTIDTETVGLNPYDPAVWIVSVQVTWEKGHSDVVYFSSRQSCLDFNGQLLLKSQIIWLLNSDIVTVRGANFKYDLNWFHVMWGISECTNFKMDTTIVGSLLDENRSNSLNVHAKLYSTMGGYDDEFNRKYDKDKMHLVPKEELLPYAAGDTDACLRASNVMVQELTEQPDLANFYVNILHPSVRAYEDVERVGWRVDLPYYHHLRDELEVELEKLRQQAKEILGGRILAKHKPKPGKDLNITKASMMKDFFFSPMGLNLKPFMKTPKTQEPSCAMEHLLMYANNPKAAPFVSLLKEYGSADKTHKTYVVGFLKHLRPDGHFHPTYFFFKGDDFNDEDGGTVTGRLSVVDPAIQTIPKHTKWTKKLRTAFIAPDGYLILSNDYSQGELKIIACLSNEEAMLAAYSQGIDLHAVTASALAGYKWENFVKLKQTNPVLYEQIRQLGKAGNFGLIYGMQASGFVAYTYSNYGLEMSEDEGEQNRNVFFGKYPDLITYHKAQIKFAHTYKCVASPLGRIRHLPLIDSPIWKISSKAERQSINSPTQATLSDMMIWSTAIMKEKGMLKKAPVFGMVHDQGLRYVPKDDWEKYAIEGKEVMENLPFEQVGWQPQLRFTVDTEIGPNLGHLEKVASLCG